MDKKKILAEVSELSGVLVMFNEPFQPRDGHGRCVESEAGVMDEVKAVCSALEVLGVPYRSCGVSRLEDISQILARNQESVVFNLVEGLYGRAEDANYVPAICTAFGKTSTGCDTDCLALSLDKYRTKAVLRSAGLAVPSGTLVPVGCIFSGEGLPDGKYIVKPCSTDASDGIDADSVFDLQDPRVQVAVNRIHERFGTPALVEEFIGNREFNVSVVESEGLVRVLPVAEIDFSAFESGKNRVVDYAAKWLKESFEYQNTPRIIPAPLGVEKEDEIKNIALRSWEALRCHDYIRVDMRMDDGGKVYVIEVNANPDISPDAGFAAALQAGGARYEEFVEDVVVNAFGRLNLFAMAGRISGDHRRMGKINIRRTEERDRDQIISWIEGTNLFGPHEIMVAREILDDVISKGPQGHYQSFTAEMGRKARGWVCFGSTPCTVNRYDIYWLIVAPESQGRGIGKTLLRYAESSIVNRGGRMIIIETSSRAGYEGTRRFYMGRGYLETARVKDFYAEDDDRIIYMKKIGGIGESINDKA